ncbi:putative [Myosin heavy-chain] kinase transcription factor WD40-like family [Lupinus albus]|uniref:Putative [Myosin heavy-chain] kinase transcription factor WD40-like family n=1 Tax=Lupinus albus TaxID=3870 RepID=A0A6A4NWB9_LUPAL|nr:putative [Myosin heavy-chain] kinase transcription factor WD40-like family [Lupinus albus]
MKMNPPLVSKSILSNPFHSKINIYSPMKDAPVSKDSTNISVSKTKLSNSSSTNRSIICSNSETDESPLSSQRFSIQDVKYQFPTKCISMPNSHSHRSIAVLSGHVGPVSCLAVCGEFILSASQGRDIIMWQKPDLRFFAKFGHGDGSVKALVSVGNKVFTAHQDSRIRVWKVSRSSENVFKLVDTLPTTKDYWGKFMKQSNYVQTRRHHKRLWIEHADSISCLTVNNGLIYSGSWDNTLKVWRLSDLKCLESIKAHDDAINGLAASKGVVYSASADGKIKGWGKEGKKDSHCLEGVLEGHKDVSFNSVVVSDDGKWVYGGGSDGFIIGWEGNGSFESWKLVCETKAHNMAVLSMCLMGGLLCSGSADKNIGIWKREVFGKLCKVGIISGHEGPVKCLQASSNRIDAGFMLYSGSLDRSVRVWWVPTYNNNTNAQVEEENSLATLSTLNQSIISC